MRNGKALVAAVPVPHVEQDRGRCRSAATCPTRATRRLFAHDLVRPAFARRSIGAHDLIVPGLRAGGKPLHTRIKSGAGLFGIMRQAAASTIAARSQSRAAREEVPVLREVAPGHRAACHFV
jgi:hypothetical protein